MFKKVLVLGILLSFCFALPVSTIDGVSNAKLMELDNTAYVQSVGKDFIEVVFNGKEMLPTASFTLSLDEIAGFDSINFYVTDITSGNMTTCNIEWKDFLDNSHGSVTLTSGTDITDFRASTAKLTFTNPVTITNNVTMNILVK